MSEKQNGLTKGQANGIVESVQDLAQLPPWLQSLRQAMSSSIKPDDLKDVMSAQMEKAKKGDIRAASFVMQQAHKMLQAETSRSITIEQHNYYDQPPGTRPDQPIGPADGRTDELNKLRSRARNGTPLVGALPDQRHKTFTDEEEKELRRLQDAEGEED